MPWLQGAILLVSCLLTSAEQSSIVVRRCCPPGERLDDYQKCVPTDEPWAITVVSTDYKKILDLDVARKRWHVVTERPTCKQPQLILFPHVLLVEDGSIWLMQEHISHPLSFCADHQQAIVCRSDDEEPSAQIQRVYVNKCCYERVHSDELGECVADAAQRDATPTGFLAAILPNSELPLNYTYIYPGYPRCDDGVIPTGILGEKGSKVLANGSLQLHGLKHTVLLEPQTFCLEWIAEEPEEVQPTVFTCPAYLPLPDNETEYEYDVRFTLYPMGLLLSVVCLSLTLAAGYLVPSSHHLLHWRCQTCHVACLLVGDLILAVVQLTGANLPPCLCAIFASTMHFFFLAAFFWLNTMCFNIWWTFRDIRPTTLDKRQESLRLRVYNAYAWGVPTFIAVTAILMDRVADDSVPSVLRPKFALSRCWFHGDSEILTYFFGPVGVLLLLNIVLFGMTTWELTCGLWKREVVKTTSERVALGRVCWKLVVVMGVTWTADVVSWLIGGPQHVWYFTDIINTLQGLFIFLVVACQPQVYAAIKRLWCPTVRSSTSANGHHQHSTSQDVPSINDSVANTNSTSLKPPPDETIC